MREEEEKRQKGMEASTEGVDISSSLASIEEEPSFSTGEVPASIGQDEPTHQEPAPEEIPVLTIISKHRENNFDDWGPITGNSLVSDLGFMAHSEEEGPDQFCKTKEGYICVLRGNGTLVKRDDLNRPNVKKELEQLAQEKVIKITEIDRSRTEAQDLKAEGIPAGMLIIGHSWHKRLSAPELLAGLGLKEGERLHKDENDVIWVRKTDSSLQERKDLNIKDYNRELVAIAPRLSIEEPAVAVEMPIQQPLAPTTSQGARPEDVPILSLIEKYKSGRKTEREKKELEAGIGLRYRSKQDGGGTRGVDELCQTDDGVICIQQGDGTLLRRDDLNQPSVKTELLSLSGFTIKKIQETSVKIQKSGDLESPITAHIMNYRMHSISQEELFSNLGLSKGDSIWRTEDGHIGVKKPNGDFQKREDFNDPYIKDELEGLLGHRSYSNPQPINGVGGLQGWPMYRFEPDNPLLRLNDETPIHNRRPTNTREANNLKGLVMGASNITESNPGPFYAQARHPYVQDLAQQQQGLDPFDPTSSARLGSLSRAVSKGDPAEVAQVGQSIVNQAPVSHIAQSTPSHGQTQRIQASRTKGLFSPQMIEGIAGKNANYNLSTRVGVFGKLARDQGQNYKGNYMLRGAGTDHATDLRIAFDSNQKGFTVSREKIVGSDRVGKDPVGAIIASSVSLGLAGACEDLKAGDTVEFSASDDATQKRLEKQIIRQYKSSQFSAHRQVLEAYNTPIAIKGPSGDLRYLNPKSKKFQSEPPIFEAPYNEQEAKAVLKDYREKTHKKGAKKSRKKAEKSFEKAQSSFEKKLMKRVEKLEGEGLSVDAEQSCPIDNDFSTLGQASPEQVQVMSTTTVTPQEVLSGFEKMQRLSGYKEEMISAENLPAGMDNAMVFSKDNGLLGKTRFFAAELVNNGKGMRFSALSHHDGVLKKKTKTSDEARVQLAEESIMMALNTYGPDATLKFNTTSTKMQKAFDKALNNIYEKDPTLLHGRDISLDGQDKRHLGKNGVDGTDVSVGVKINRADPDEPSTRSTAPRRP